MHRNPAGRWHRGEGLLILLAPGRIGAQWISILLDRYAIKARYGPLDVGVRIEVPSIIMDPITRINRDPKFHIVTAGTTTSSDLLHQSGWFCGQRGVP